MSIYLSYLLVITGLGGPIVCTCTIHTPYILPSSSQVPCVGMLWLKLQRVWPVRFCIVALPPPFLIDHSRHSTIPFIRLWARVAGNIHWKIILLYCTPTIVHLTYHLQVCRSQNLDPWRNDKMQHNNERSINHQPNITNTVQLLIE